MNFKGINNPLIGMIINTENKKEWKKRYQLYLRSDHWKALRGEKFREVGKKCNRCGKTKTIQVHHRVYRSSWHDALLSDLEVLCRACHRIAHGLKEKELPASVKFTPHTQKSKAKWKKDRKKWHRNKKRDNQLLGRSSKRDMRRMAARIEMDSRPGNSHYLIIPGAR